MYVQSKSITKSEFLKENDWRNSSSYNGAHLRAFYLESMLIFFVMKAEEEGIVVTKFSLQIL